MTIEFWFRNLKPAMMQELEEAYMVSLWDEASREVLSILRTDTIECAYNNTQGVRVSARSNKVEENGWMNIICSVQ